ncbi:MAG: hypothetical protein ABIR55_20835 [Burkholderiaceae bacterium]
MIQVARLAAPGRHIPFVELPRASTLAGPKPMREERLPFTVRLVNNDADLSKAVAIRAAAYGRHMPEFAEALRVPESIDSEPGVIVLLAESKLDGSPMGTLRIQSNAYKPLKVEQSVALPHWLRDRPLVEGSRLGIVGGPIGRLVKMVLIKATLQYCAQTDIDWAIVAARAPLDRPYDQMMFEDLYPEQGFIPMRHGNNIPHRVLGFEIETGYQRLVDATHPLLQFMYLTHHPDIDLRLDRDGNLGELFPAPTQRVVPPLGRRPV